MFLHPHRRERIGMSDGTKVGLYHRKSTQVEAILYDGTNLKDILEWGVQVDSSPGSITWPDNPTIYIWNSTEKTHLLVQQGQWIIRGVLGEFYPCDPDVFAATYQVVDEETITVQGVGLEISDGPN
jgi:hypothetical protein